MTKTEGEVLVVQRWNNSRQLDGDHWELRLKEGHVWYMCNILFDTSGDDDEWVCGYAIFTRVGFARFL